MSTVSTGPASEASLRHDTAPAGAVVVGFDGSAPSELALDWAVDEAVRSGRPLHLVTAWAIPYSMPAPLAVDPRTIPDPDEPLRQALERVKERAPQLAVTTEDGGPSAAVALIEASRTAQCVVVGTRGHRPVQGALLGSTSLQVSTHAHCPVVVVRELHPRPDVHPRVVVGVDGSEVSRDAIGYAFAQASERGIGLTIVHAWTAQYIEGATTGQSGEDAWQRVVEEEYAVTSESLAGWAERYPDVDVRTHVVRQHPVDALVSESRTAELLVVGSRGRGGFRGLLLGSVGQGVLPRAHCPVAVVRPKDAATA